MNGLAMTQIQPLLELSKYCLWDFLPSIGSGLSCEGVSPQGLDLIANNAAMENNDKAFCYCENDAAFEIIQNWASIASQPLNF